MRIMSLTDMRMTPDEAQDFYCPSPLDAPMYPPGLCLYFCQDELDKLGIDYDSICVGDIVHLHALAMITSKSCSERQNGEPNKRVEVQLTHLAGVESEDEEDDEAEEVLSSKPGRKIVEKLYKE